MGGFGATATSAKASAALKQKRRCRDDNVTHLMSPFLGVRNSADPRGRDSQSPNGRIFHPLDTSDEYHGWMFSRGRFSIVSRKYNSVRMRRTSFTMASFLPRAVRIV